MSIRLIDTTTLRMKVFVGDNIPKYAILSHTWAEDEEIDFQEMTSIIRSHEHPATRKSGYDKIWMTCTQARRDKIGYAWVDTCCIDKSSSAELSEAINSMFKWYHDADVCYAFLADLPHKANIKSSLPSCRWFDRGWTLQEMIAPRCLRFYDEKWNFIGTKQALDHKIRHITGVDEVVLHNSDALHVYPVARRFSWASRRKTQRVEDMAYCLLGIFGVNMPLLYGEGRKAFVRLQEEIIRQSNDLSIFWNFPRAEDLNNRVIEPASTSLVDIDTFFSLGYGLCGSNLGSEVAANASCEGMEEQGLPYRTVLAQSPGDFARCDDVVPYSSDVMPLREFSLTNNGIRFDNAEFRILPIHEHSGCYYVMDLEYVAGKELRDCTMVLRKIAPKIFMRCQLLWSQYREVADFAHLKPRANEVTVVEDAYIVTNFTSLVQRQLLSSHKGAIQFDFSATTTEKASFARKALRAPFPRATGMPLHRDF